MGIANLKYKYILAFILLLGIFLCGYNCKQWYVMNHRVKKHISLVYSFSANEISNLNFEKLLKQEFINQGIEPIFDKFYLDGNHLDEQKKISHESSIWNLLKQTDRSDSDNRRSSYTFSIINPAQVAQFYPDSCLQCEFSQ